VPLLPAVLVAPVVVPMPQVPLLSKLPRIRRNIAARAAGRTPEALAAANAFGALYFDGPREMGYGGYRYDGRWQPVARDIIRHFGLKPGDRVLDVGCAKGFLVKDLMAALPGLEAFGIDVSDYALMHCEPEVVGRLHLGSCVRLPFPDRSFAAVLSINTIHNLERPDVVRALREIERLAPGRGFVQVDSYLTPAERDLFMSWVLTAKYHDYPPGWQACFAEAGYTGDYDWTVVE
jgi:SAM-dependent methyltransferase